METNITKSKIAIFGVDERSDICTNRLKDVWSTSYFMKFRYILLPYVYCIEYNNSYYI